MSQEEFHRFPQGGFPEAGHGLSVFLDRHMQRVTTSQNLPCRDEAFEVRRNQRIDGLRIERQPTQDLTGDALRL